MRIDDCFKPKRFYLLMKRDFYTQYKTYVLGLGAIFCILFIVNIASIASYEHWDFNLVFYPLTLFIGGAIFTSMCFQELYQEQSRISYVILPASGLEKMLSKLVITSISYVIVSLVLYFIFSTIAFFVNTLFFGIAHRIFNPFHPTIWLCIRIYLVVQSVFFLGAVYFRKNAFMKTILSLFGLAVVYSVFVMVLFFLLYIVFSFNRHMYFSYEFFSYFGSQVFHYPPVLKDIAGVLSYVMKIIFWYILAPFLWVVSFLRFKEIGVKGEL